MAAATDQGTKVEPHSELGIKPSSIDVRESNPHSHKSVQSESARNDKANTDDSPIPPSRTAAAKTPITTTKGPFLRLFKYGTVIEHSLRGCGALAAVVLGTAVPLMAIVLGALVNDLNDWGAGDQDISTIKRHASENALYLVYIFVACLLSAYISALCFKISATRAASNLRQSFLHAVLSQDIGFLDTCSPGSISTLISNNGEMVELGLGERLTLLISGITTLLTSLIVACIQAWQVTLVVIASIIVSSTCASYAFKADAKTTTKLLAIYARAAGLAEEALSTMQVVAAFGAQGKLQRKFDGHLDAAKQVDLKQGPMAALRYGAVFMGMYVSYAMAWFVGAYLVAEGIVGNGGSIVVVIYALLTASASINSVASTIPDVSKAAGAAQGLFDIIDRKPTVNSLSDEGHIPESGPGGIALRNVSFAYPSRPSVKVLQDVSIDFEAGKTTAIVGPSGSGKSTILALLTRWFEPDAGYILLDDADTSTVNIQWLRKRMGFVQQEPILFRDTIFNNVAHGLERAAVKQTKAEQSERVMQACRRAFAKDFIETLPDGYETILGDRGDTLSGGQKQRLAIARSIVSDPPILLLDEATSALDPAAEKIVQSALENVSRSRTTIVIAHKLSTVRGADKIVVMSEGRVVEQGTHAELLAMQGTYTGLVDAQTASGLTSPPISAARTKAELTRAMSSEKQQDRDEKTEAVETGNVSSKTKTPFIASFLLRIIAYRRNLWSLHLGTLLCSTAAGSLYPAQALVFSRAVTIFQYQVPEKSSSLRSEGFFWGGMYIVLAVGVLIAYTGFRFFSSLAAALISRDYRSEYFSAMLRQDASFFDDSDANNAAGAMAARLSTNPQRVHDLIATNIGFMIVALINVISSSILALAVAWRLALVAIAGGLLPLLISGFFRIRIESMSQAYNAETYRECGRFAGEAVGAMRTVLSLTLERKIMAQYQSKLSTALRKMARYNAVSAAFVALTDSMFFASVALVFWYGTVMVAEGAISVQNFFVVFVATIVGGHSAGFMFGFTLHTTKARGAANDMFSLLDARAPINSSGGMAPPDAPVASTSAILFTSVTFRYPSRPQKPALDKLNLRIPRGAHVGIVGSSGSGKSTIISMIERFHDPSSGTVHIDTVPLTALDVHAHRCRIGYVSQQTMLYDGTIRENILLGVADEKRGGTSSADSSRDADRVIQACRAANIHDFITSLPQGYDTEVGARGVALSGGQRQRMAIARALIRDPDILLFDEATSALDSQGERVVQQAIERVARADVDRGAGESEEKDWIMAGKTRTTVVVAHRLSTVRICERIFVVHEGAVSEEGSHDELMARKGRYYEMVLAQALDS